MISNDLHSQIFGQNADRIVRNPYFLSFYSVVVQFVEYAATEYPGERIDFIFDTQPGQMESAVGSWERLKEVTPENLKSFIGNVSFNDDKDVLPLQAADLSAGWTREQADAFLRGEDSPEPFGEMPDQKSRPSPEPGRQNYMKIWQGGLELL